MKRALTLLFILAIVLFSYCDKIPENNDPILGVWYKEEVFNSENQTSENKEEWIFNDAYMGRYNVYDNNKLLLKTDFQWREDKGMYTLSYPGIEKEEQRARMVKMEGHEVLQDEVGEVVAIRQ